MTDAAPPLRGIKVLDFSTLLPGPMASLLLAEAGAEVLKVERPNGGDEMRSYAPALEEVSTNFALLNRGKGSLAVDLKNVVDLERLRPLLDGADVLIEQFRPGVMARLGLDYDTLRQTNPGLIYCSITGYGQSGARANEAGHDLNYMAEAGLLSLVCASDGSPGMPPVLVADICGGAYPAAMNILLALRGRDLTGQGCHIDVAMTDNLFPLAYWALGIGFGHGEWPRPGGELVTGGSPRYRLYRTSDDKFLAVAPIEERFWQTFCETVELPESLRLASVDPRTVIETLASIIASRSALEWKRTFAGKDVCVNVVRGLDEAVSDPAFRARGLFDRNVADGSRQIPALPVPIAPQLLEPGQTRHAPRLGEMDLDVASSAWRTE